MKDRLQFRHHDAIFNTREDAINYITNDIRYSENGLSKDDIKQHFSLYAEPTVLRYKNADDESNPHIILAIGSKSNQVEGAQYAFTIGPKLKTLTTSSVSSTSTRRRMR